MEIKVLKEIGFDELYGAFSEAFKDYEMQLDRNGLSTMLNRRGFDPGLSFGAFEDGRLVAFTFNGTGRFGGKMTAYDTGTGTIREFRGRGLASQIFQNSVPFLKQAGIKQYLLEVLQHNDAAVSVYRKQGFEVTREFNYFIQEKGKVVLPDQPDDKSINIRKIDISQRIQMQKFMDFQPSWQNSFGAVGRKPEDFIILGAFVNNALAGHCILEPASGDITQIAVDRDHRRKGIATKLMAEILQFNQSDVVKVINTEDTCEAMTRFLASLEISLKGKQYEMVKHL